jgi:hypothetical protein
MEEGVSLPVRLEDVGFDLKVPTVGADEGDIGAGVGISSSRVTVGVTSDGRGVEGFVTIAITVGRGVVRHDDIQSLYRSLSVVR